MRNLQNGLLNCIYYIWISIWIEHLFYQRLFKWTFIISAISMLVVYGYKDKFPDPDTYDLSILTPPIQTTTSREPFSVDLNHQHYLITPKFDYELTGVVVTYNDSDGLTDIWHHDLWKDFLNVRDLCVIWGSNVSSGIYKKIYFSSDSWTCWVLWEDRSTTKLFKFNALSNNHILTDNNRIKEILLNAEKGDTVHFKGVLAEYKNDAVPFERGTSITRTDTGNGACETVYIDEFKIVKKANSTLRNFYWLMKWTAIISFLGIVVMFIRTPFKAR